MASLINILSMVCQMFADNKVESLRGTQKNAQADRQTDRQADRQSDR